MNSNITICEILKFIDDNLNQKIDIQDLANRFYINKFYLMKLFKREIGITINNYINYIRIYNSLKHLKEGNTILKTALLNGFNSQEYYSEIFKSIMKVNPITYKKYANFNKDITNDQINTILLKIVDLKDIINKKETYLNNRFPQENLHVLTLYTRK